MSLLSFCVYLALVLFLSSPSCVRCSNSKIVRLRYGYFVESGPHLAALRNRLFDVNNNNSYDDNYNNNNNSSTNSNLTIQVVGIAQQSGARVISQLNNNEIELGECGCVPVFQALSRGDTSFRIVGMAEKKGTSQNLVVRPSFGLTHPSQLSGLRIGVQLYTTAHYMLLALLHELALNPRSDVYILGITQALLPAAYSAGTIDAAFAWGAPLRALVNAGAQTLFTGAESEAFGYPTFNFVVVRADVNAQYPWFVQHVLNVRSVLEHSFTVSAAALTAAAVAASSGAVVTSALAATTGEWAVQSPQLLSLYQTLYGVQPAASVPMQALVNLLSDTAAFDYFASLTDERTFLLSIASQQSAQDLFLQQQKQEADDEYVAQETLAAALDTMYLSSSISSAFTSSLLTAFTNISLGPPPYPSFAQTASTSCATTHTGFNVQSTTMGTFNANSGVNNAYLNSQTCVWQLLAVSTGVYIQFTALSLEHGYDVITIVDTANPAFLVARITGFILPPLLFYAKPVTVTFTADSTSAVPFLWANWQGFVASYFIAGASSSPFSCTLCRNGGVCALPSSTVCTCPAGYYGAMCESATCIGTSLLTLSPPLSPSSSSSSSSVTIRAVANTSLTYTNGLDCRWIVSCVSSVQQGTQQQCHFRVDWAIVNTDGPFDAVTVTDDAGRQLDIVYGQLSPSSSSLPSASYLHSISTLTPFLTHTLTIQFTSDVSVTRTTGFVATVSVVPEVVSIPASSLSSSSSSVRAPSYTACIDATGGVCSGNGSCELVRDYRILSLNSSSYPSSTLLSPDAAYNYDYYACVCAPLYHGSRCNNRICSAINTLMTDDNGTIAAAPSYAANAQCVWEIAPTQLQSLWSSSSSSPSSVNTSSSSSVYNGIRLILARVDLEPLSGDALLIYGRTSLSSQFTLLHTFSNGLSVCHGDHDCGVGGTCVAYTMNATATAAATTTTTTTTMYRCVCNPAISIGADCSIPVVVDVHYPNVRIVFNSDVNNANALPSSARSPAIGVSASLFAPAQASASSASQAVAQSLGFAFSYTSMYMCPYNQCSGHGVCLVGVCACTSGYTGIGCESAVRTSVYVSSESAQTLYVLSFFVAFAAFVIIFLVYIYREAAVFKASSVSMLVLILSAIILSCVSAATLIMPPSSTVCGARVWLLLCSLCGIMTPLLLKTWRIYQIFDQKELHVQKITDTRLTAYMCVIYALQLILLIVWTGFGLPTETQTTIDATHYYLMCTVDNTFLAIMLTFHYLVLVIAAIISFLSRNLPSSFHESSGILFSIYNILLLGSFIVCLEFVLTTDNFLLLVLVRAYGQLLISSLILAAIFAPKLAVLIGGEGRITVTKLSDQSVQLKGGDNEKRQTGSRVNLQLSAAAAPRPPSLRHGHRPMLYVSDRDGNANINIALGKIRNAKRSTSPNAHSPNAFDSESQA